MDRKAGRKTEDTITDRNKTASFSPAHPPTHIETDGPAGESRDGNIHMAVSGEWQRGTSTHHISVCLCQCVHQTAPLSLLCASRQPPGNRRATDTDTCCHS
mmetsp:Transcript_17749/g.50440  ORF Transcript_17749/g.50440 Transcript_17749/m.50440 type:complete len:101 (-) Transcript_17749:474-776(-)